MDAVTIITAASIVFLIACVLMFLLKIIRWLERRTFLRLEEGPHKSTMRLAEQLDTAWRRNRRRERDL